MPPIDQLDPRLEDLLKYLVLLKVKLIIFTKLIKNVLID